VTERIVKVSLQAQVANYVAGMETARKSTESVGKSAVDAKAKFEAQNQAMTQIGAGLLAVGTLAAVGVGLAVKAYAEFDAAMSNVAASTHESAENMSLLRDAAIEAGATTVFTATEAAGAIDELAKAGIKTADILGGGLAGSLDLASAGGLAVADAAAVAATALTQFKLKGEDIPHVADLLAAGAGKAQGSVDDLSQALNQGGLVASQAGFSIEETTGVLAAFASAGLKGSDAGTSLKTAILALQKPSTAAQTAMDQYGISVYNSNGTMKSFAQIAEELKAGLGSLTEEQRNSTLATIFGTDAVRSAGVLYTQGAAGINNWNMKVNDAGYAAETAALKLDNLKGDVEKLGGAFDTGLIKAGGAADSTLRLLVQSATALVDMFNEAPLVVQQAALVLGVVAAGVTLTGGAFLVAVPKIAAFQMALTTLQESSMPSVAAGATRLEGAMTKTGGAIGKAAGFLTGPWGIALAGAAIGGKILLDVLESLKTSAADYQNIIQNADSSDDLFAAADKGRLISFLGEATASAETFKRALNEMTNDPIGAGFNTSTLQLKQSLKDIGTQLATTAATDLPGAAKAFKVLASDMELTKTEQLDLLNSMPAFKDALQAQANELGINTDSTDEAANNTALLKLAFEEATPTALDAADAYLAAGDEASELSAKVVELVEAINAANGVGQDAVSSNSAYLDSLAGITTEIAAQRTAYEEANGTAAGFAFTLDESTAAGAANAAMLADVAGKAQAAAKAQYDVDITTMGAKDATDKYAGTLATTRQSIIDNAVANGANADQVKLLADRIFALPSEKQVAVLAETANATREINEWLSIQNGKSVRIAVGLGGAGGLTKADGGIVDYYANGGIRRENHVAEIAPAGSYRVWAESETGGESYIPLSPAKRARSLDIWAETGSRLGVQGFANGGIQYASQGPMSYGFSSQPAIERAGDTWNITEVSDAQGTATAVLRRIKKGGS
jgi:TP901 family phage tail tape measure protein